MIDNPIPIPSRNGRQFITLLTPVVRPLSSPVRSMPGNGEENTSNTQAVPIVTALNLAKRYQVDQTSVHALRGVSLTIQKGEFVAITGTSGSGKSTFMNIVGCLDRPTHGDYRFLNTSIGNITASQRAMIRNKYIGFIFQGFHLLKRSTALKNVALPLLYAGVPQEEREELAYRALKQVNLEARVNHKPSQLSGGQQQRVAIARALVNRPALLLADEPTGNLDTRTSIEIMQLLEELHRQGITIVLVTHEPDIAAYAKRQVEFRDGRIVRDEVTSHRRLPHADWLDLVTKDIEQPQALSIHRTNIS